MKRHEVVLAWGVIMMLVTILLMSAWVFVEPTRDVQKRKHAVGARR